jgi:hypothetical protein
MICILSAMYNKDVFYCSTSMVAIPIKITNHATCKIRRKKKTLDMIYGTTACVQVDMCCLQFDSPEFCWCVRTRGEPPANPKLTLAHTHPVPEV